MRSSTPATAALARAGVVHREHEFKHDSRVTGYGREAAEQLGVDAQRVFKTLICSAGATLASAVVPVSADLDLKAVAALLGAKTAAIADVTAAQRSTGYVVGGISPIGQKRVLPTLLDRSAIRWPTIFVSGGRRGLEIELTPTDLLALTQGRLADIARARSAGPT